jgi:hypothetical protein
MGNYYIEDNKTLYKLQMYYLSSLFNIFQVEENTNKTLFYYLNYFPLQQTKYNMIPYSPFLDVTHTLFIRKSSHSKSFQLKYN